MIECDKAEFFVSAPLDEFLSFLKEILGIHQVEPTPKRDSSNVVLVRIRF